MRTRPNKLKRGFGRKNGPPRIQESFCGILVAMPVNLATMANNAIVSSTGRDADINTFSSPYSADGNLPATHYVASWILSDALDTRNLIRQMASGNPSIKACVWPAGRLADHAELLNDYNNVNNIEILSEKPNIQQWLAANGLVPISEEI